MYKCGQLKAIRCLGLSVKQANILNHRMNKVQGDPTAAAQSEALQQKAREDSARAREIQDAARKELGLGPDVGFNGVEGDSKALTWNSATQQHGEIENPEAIARLREMFGYQ